MPSQTESERLTRKRRIDPRLDARDWPLAPAGAIPLRRPYRTEEEPTAAGPADYALWLAGRIVGLVEAKRVALGSPSDLTQAERYARGLERGHFDFDGLRCPFLVAMATGTGKTLMVVNHVYRLMKAGVAKRVLFLVDRRALAAQAVRAFAAFAAEPGLKFDQVYEVYGSRFQREDLDPGERFDPKVLPTTYLTDPQPGHAFWIPAFAGMTTVILAVPSGTEARLESWRPLQPCGLSLPRQSECMTT